MDNNNNVIGIHANKELIARLKSLAVRAEQGEVCAMYGVIVGEEGCELDVTFGGISYEVVGAVEVLKSMMLGDLFAEEMEGDEGPDWSR